MTTEPGTVPGVLTEEQALQLVAFLASAAEITLVEPTYYGTFRLIDAASRMIGYMLENGNLESEEFLREFKRELDTKKVWMMWDREAYYDFLRAAPGEVAGELRRRHEADGRTGA